MKISSAWRQQCNKCFIVWYCKWANQSTESNMSMPVFDVHAAVWTQIVKTAKTFSLPLSVKTQKCIHTEEHFIYQNMFHYFALRLHCKIFELKLLYLKMLIFNFFTEIETSVFSSDIIICKQKNMFGSGSGWAIVTGLCSSSVVHKRFYLNIFCSETTHWILTKLHRNDPWVVPHKWCLNGSDWLHM